MTLMPISDREEQDRAFATMLSAFTGEESRSAFPFQGAAVDRANHVHWRWVTVPKPGHSHRLLRVNNFRVGAARLRVTVPIGYIDVNDLGLLAQASSGERYLARQKIPHRNRAGSTTSEAYSKRHSPIDYPTLLVPGSSTRVYYGIVPLDSGEQTLLAAIERAMSSQTS